MWNETCTHVHENCVSCAPACLVVHFWCSLAIFSPVPANWHEQIPLAVRETKNKTKQCQFIFVCALCLLAFGGYEFQSDYFQWLEWHQRIVLVDFIDETMNLIVVDGGWSISLMRSRALCAIVGFGLAISLVRWFICVLSMDLASRLHWWSGACEFQCLLMSWQLKLLLGKCECCCVA